MNWAAFANDILQWLVIVYIIFIIADNNTKLIKALKNLNKKIDGKR